MTQSQIIDKINHYKATSALLRTEHGTQQTTWWIEDVDPELLISLQEPLGVTWWRCNDKMALHVYGPYCLICIFSYPVDIKEQLTFIKK